MKSCKQCGEIKPESQFRRYYGGRQGTYTMCKSCERINSRVKYLEKKESLTPVEQVELNKIYTLYDAQRACGLRPPRREGPRKLRGIDNLDDLIETYKQRANIPHNVGAMLDTSATPPELMKWLSAKLIEHPDYYLDEVYEDLKARYRPVLRIDTVTMLPEHDDTHIAVLDAILDRFNSYEDEYYNEEE